MDITEIEVRANLIFNAAKSIGDEQTIAAANAASFILAEVRHYCQSIAALHFTEHEKADKALFQSLRNSFVGRRS